LQALADFDGIVLANAQNAQAHYGRAYVLSEFPGRQQAAIDAAHEAVRIDANHLGARCTLAVVLARAGAYDEAIDQIERALAQNDAGFVRYSAACVYALASSTEPEFLDRGFELLESALQQNYGRQSFTSDKDLGALRELQRFDELSARFMAP
jgi:tetratricopeptide (TPR) repeat protein